MKYSSCAVAFAAALVLQAAHSAKLRSHNSSVRVDNEHFVSSKTSVVAAGTKNNRSSSCLQREEASNLAVDAADHGQVAKRTKMSKVRVCNAITTEREAIINVFLNGKELTAKDGMAQRKCSEFVIPVSATNKFEVKLTGEVSADWSGEKTESEMMNMPVLFLVAHVFWQGPATTFSVDEFQPENHGLKQVQIAYMDVFRGHDSEAKLQLISPGGEFEMSASTFSSICGGQYTLRFVEGDTAKEASSPAHFKAGEQYIVLRIAPEKQQDGGNKAEAVIVYPEETGSSDSMGTWFPAHDDRSAQSR